MLDFLKTTCYSLAIQTLGNLNSAAKQAIFNGFAATKLEKNEQYYWY